MSSRRELANAIRVLSIDAIQKAKSGHPGAPMGMADIAEVLWNDHLKHNPANPNWADRDRFVLSNGHASMLLYSLLHLTGYDLDIEELKSFRQLGSKTAGHPECTHTPGVETTTGPLGQGISNAVGMALAEKTLAAQFNQDGHEIVNHHTYSFLGDGCMMEGISHESCALAGTLGLGKLIAFWDDNGISIDGETKGWFGDDTPKRFEAYNWQVIRDVDGHDGEAVNAAIIEAKNNTAQPTLICCKTTIGFGSPNMAGSHNCHGAPLGDEEIALTRKQLGWEYDAFVIPEQVYSGWDAKEQGANSESAWDQKFAAYKEAHPDLAAEFNRRMAGDLPVNWQEEAAKFIAEINEKAESPASRKASQIALNGYGPLLPELLGGSADLTPSNLTAWSGSQAITDGHEDGNYLSYGVREFGMTAMMNGIALHGGFIPYAGTFLVFSEYARNALRMAALMKQRVISVYTHDSIGLGEDGPTHQPVEQTSTLRLMPNMHVWRPCDAVETAVGWKASLDKADGPSCHILSRQGLPHQFRTEQQISDIAKGGYALVDCDGMPDVIIIATGSEVSLAVKAAAESNKKIRVVSMPCTEAFQEQDAAYRESILPSSVTARVAIEAGVTNFWYQYVGLSGKVIGLDRFGESAPAGQLFETFGFTVENLLKAVDEVAA